MKHLSDDDLIRALRKKLDSGEIRAMIREAIDRNINVEVSLYEGFKGVAESGGLHWVDKPRIEVRGTRG